MPSIFEEMLLREALKQVPFISVRAFKIVHVNCVQKQMTIQQGCQSSALLSITLSDPPPSRLMKNSQPNGKSVGGAK